MALLAGTSRLLVSEVDVGSIRWMDRTIYAFMEQGLGKLLKGIPFNLPEPFAAHPAPTRSCHGIIFHRKRVPNAYL